MEESLFQEMAEKWPSAWVARTEIERFTGGILKEKYLANLDSAGKGPAGRVRSGRKVCYKTSEVVKWLESRSAIIPKRQRRDLD
ncbi:MAG: hypothetical protein ABH891_00015 [Candidatus Omnitrophota bacterium]